jgi:quercetin dioxygenase-like cupin family protein
MKVTRLYPGSDGNAHFEDIEFSLDINGGAIQRSKPSKATGVFFSVTDGPYFRDWHATPHRQYIIILEGEVEVGVSENEKRRFGPGNVLLMDDTTGRGHTTRSVNDQLRKEVFVTLE